MKYLKYFVFFLLAAIIALAIYGAVLDSKYDVNRSRTIKAPVEVVFENIIDFKNWENWNPWFEEDPTMVATYPDTTSGVGASYSWKGKKNSGTLKTISIVPNKEIIHQINFGKSSTPEIYWKFNEVDQGTEVIWGMRGEKSFTEKFYWLFNGGIEQNTIPTHDRGLVLLEQHILRELEKHSFEMKGIIDHGGGYYLFQTISCQIQEIEQKMKEMFPMIEEYMAKNKIDASGKPFTLFHKRDEQNNTTIFSACIPVKERVIIRGNVLTGYLKPQKTFKTIFKGDYKFSNEAWEAAYKGLAAQGYVEIEGAEPFEIYTVGPNDTGNPAKWVTEIYIPIK